MLDGFSILNDAKLMKMVRLNLIPARFSGWIALLAEHTTENK